MPMTMQEELVYARLNALGIAFVRHEHEAVATVNDAEAHWAGIDAMHFKNLFVRNQKVTPHYLVIVRHSKRADLRALADQIGDGKLSFGSPERLMTHLGVTPGSVSPFGLIHDLNHAVRVVIDRELKTADRVSFHPNINTVTITLTRSDFEAFLADSKNPVQYVRSSGPPAQPGPRPLSFTCEPRNLTYRVKFRVLKGSSRLWVVRDGMVVEIPDRAGQVRSCQNEPSPTVQPSLKAQPNRTGRWHCGASERGADTCRTRRTRWCLSAYSRC